MGWRHRQYRRALVAAVEPEPEMAQATVGVGDPAPETAPTAGSVAVVIGPATA